VKRSLGTPRSTSDRTRRVLADEPLTPVLSSRNVSEIRLYRQGSDNL